MPSPTSPQASAILAVYNSESTIERAITTLVSQSVRIEIIVVDDGSTDDTLAILESYSRQITLLTQSHQGPALARNLGAAQAHAPILLFVDADMTFDPDYVRDLIDPIQKGEVIGTYTVEERVANWDNPYARCWNLEEGWEAGKRFPPNPPRFGTDFRAILKSEFEKAGGFDSIGYTDTWTLFQKLGVRPLATRAVCYHRNPSTLREILHQARWSAKRPYKFGLFGNLFALVRASLPVSVLIAASGTIRHANFAYFPFKLTYDFGRFIGILEYLLTGKLTK